MLYKVSAMEGWVAGSSFFLISRDLPYTARHCSFRPNWCSTAAMLLRVEAVSRSAASPSARRILSARMKKARLSSNLPRSLWTTPRWWRAMAQPPEAASLPGPADATNFSRIFSTCWKQVAALSRSQAEDSLLPYSCPRAEAVFATSAWSVPRSFSWIVSSEARYSTAFSKWPSRLRSLAASSNASMVSWSCSPFRRSYLRAARMQ
mmetsp:Transcript_26986/g.60358  ORF Transcript_26986/g.60358 Transcript_26986/m.60358 type:complete len:206 (+) Transcript_26986:612-1229(+)